MLEKTVYILKFSVVSIDHDQGHDIGHDHDHDLDHGGSKNVTNLTVGGEMVGKKVKILKFSVKSIDNDNDYNIGDPRRPPPQLCLHNWQC